MNSVHIVFPAALCGTHELPKEGQAPWGCRLCQIIMDLNKEEKENG